MFSRIKKPGKTLYLNMEQLWKVEVTDEKPICATLFFVGVDEPFSLNQWETEEILPQIDPDVPLRVAIDVAVRDEIAELTKTMPLSESPGARASE